MTITSDLEDYWRVFVVPGLTMGSVVSYLASGMMIFGGVIPYIPQYQEISSTKNTEGFSTFVCFTLLVANTLRIFFWFGHPFEGPLLAQSVVMILAMLGMIRLCTVVQAETEIIASKQHKLTDINGDENSPHQCDKTSYEVKPKKVFTDFDRHHFWKWTDFESYIQFMLLFSLLIAAVTYLFMGFTVYVETLGFLAVFFEALLGVPQLYRNFVNKSTTGMSVKMVLLWLAGDLFKTCYFILRDSPIQFWLCGILQVTLDVMILAQVFYYTAIKTAVQ